MSSSLLLPWLTATLTVALPLLSCAHAPAPEPTPRPRPAAGLHDPSVRFELKLRLRRQILQRTRGVEQDHFQHHLRPQLERQLRRMGLDEQDVAELLADVERSHAWR